jgi:hypothetical protein
MKFDVALKDTPIGGLVGEVLERTSRFYPCIICKKVTGWRKLLPDCPGVPVCSDECLDASNEREVPE